MEYIDDFVWIQGLILMIAIALTVKLVKTIHDRRAVKTTSIRLEKLKEINKKYTFHDDVPKRYGLAIMLPNKAKYDRYELSDLVDNNIVGNEKFQRFLNRISYNISRYADYTSEIAPLMSEISEEQAKELHISGRTYREIEQKLLLKTQLKPVVESKIVCLAKYTTPKGRNTYTKTNVFDVNYCLNRRQILAELLAMEATEPARRKRERSLMTDKLRYMILRRDGFRCQLCGRSANDGIKLHVDHIIPISKGGRTIESNLRVLCEDCNLGKGDTIE